MRLGTGGPFAFPQNKKPASCALTTVANASASTQSAYTTWKSAFVTSSGAGAGLRVQRDTNQNDTVSEGIGYGMLAAVYMDDKATFDGLWAYAKAHFDAQGLMNWHIDAGGTPVANDMGSATDGDEDMAWALLMASDQWSSATYLSDGVSVINAMLGASIAPDGTLKPGDNWGGTDVTYPDYFSPAYFRVFAKATNNTNWSGAIIDRNYAILAAVSGADGLVPDHTTSAYTLTQNSSYDACRTPWRIGMDYCFNGEPRAQAYLMKVGAFFNGIGASNIIDGYSTSGQASSGWPSRHLGHGGLSDIARRRVRLRRCQRRRHELLLGIAARAQHVDDVRQFRGLHQAVTAPHAGVDGFRRPIAASGRGFGSAGFGGGLCRRFLVQFRSLHVKTKEQAP